MHVRIPADGSRANTVTRGPSSLNRNSQDKTRQNTVTSLRRAVYKLAVTIGNDFIHAVLQVTCSCANPICKYLGLLMLHTNARCMRLPTG